MALVKHYCIIRVRSPEKDNDITAAPHDSPLLYRAGELGEDGFSKSVLVSVQAGKDQRYNAVTYQTKERAEKAMAKARKNFPTTDYTLGIIAYDDEDINRGS